MRNMMLAAVIPAMIVSGCSTLQGTHRGAVAYNKAFADARNEILLLNILRASYGEPTQFSTIGSVAGGMRPDLSGSSELTNLLANAADTLKLTGNAGIANPTVTITPLDTKEFREGMMRPISAQLVDEMIAQGTDAEALLNLAVAGVVCGDQARPLLNRGLDADQSRFGDATAHSLGWDLDTKDAEKIGELLLPANEAAKVLKEGVGEGSNVKLAPINHQPGKGQIRLLIYGPEGTVIKNTAYATLCPGEGKFANNLVTDKAPPSAGTAKILLRSPIAMIQYLGTLHRYQVDTKFLRLRSPNRLAIPEDAPARVRWDHRLLYVASKRQIANETAEDKTLETLAVLSDIIGLQTTNATVQSARPILTVPTQ